MTTNAKWDPGPAGSFTDITKDDVTVYDPPIRALYVGTGGTVIVKDPSGNTGTHKNVPSGSVICANVRQVMSTDTTASDFVAYY